MSRRCPRPQPVSATADRLRRLSRVHRPHLPRHRLDHLLRRLPLHHHYVESPQVNPASHRRCLQPSLRIAMTVRRRRSLSTRAITTRILRPRFLTRMRSRLISASRALRTSCPRNPRLPKHLPSPLQPRRAQVRPQSQANLPRKLDSLSICPEPLPRRRRHLPRRRRGMMMTMTPTTIPPPLLSRRYPHSRCPRPLRI